MATKVQWHLKAEVLSVSLFPSLWPPLSFSKTLFSPYFLDVISYAIFVKITIGERGERGMVGDSGAPGIPGKPGEAGMCYL